MPSSLRASNAHFLITAIPKAQQATISLSHILEKLKVKLRQTRLKKKKNHRQVMMQIIHHNVVMGYMQILYMQS